MNKLSAYDDNDEKSRWAYQEGIKYFKEHAMKHFAEEELYMASIGYEGYDVHRRIHDTFRKKTLPEIEKELAESYYSMESVKHFPSFVMISIYFVSRSALFTGWKYRFR